MHIPTRLAPCDIGMQVQSHEGSQPSIVLTLEKLTGRQGYQG